MTNIESNDLFDDSEVAPLLTEGQRLVGFDFNPSGDSYVTDVKANMAIIADDLIERRNNKNNSYTMNLLIGAALVAVSAACMAVIKVVTYKY